MSLIDSAINNFLLRNSSANKAESNDDSSTVRISFPFKDQVAVNAVRTQLSDLSHAFAFMPLIRFSTRKSTPD